jgi:tRNA threonylcarbamoyladenosine biosynthesis protein TsaE
MTTKKQSYTIDDLESIADLVLDLCDEDNIILFYGEMGSGKTTLIKAICKLLGIKEHTSSPSYALINEYDADGDRVYHMDLFRLKDVEEAIDLGIEDYLYSDALCLIEWPQLINELLPMQYTEVRLKGLDANSREIHIIKVDVTHDV